VQRGIVHGRVADTKTEYSTDDLPLDPGFAELLKDWQAIAPQSETGWVFVNPATGKPYHAAPIQQDYFRPAGQIAGLKGELGWHSFPGGGVEPPRAEARRILSPIDTQLQGIA
jgi:hypothetical protein